MSGRSRSERSELARIRAKVFIEFIRGETAVDVHRKFLPTLGVRLSLRTIQRWRKMLDPELRRIRRTNQNFRSVTAWQKHNLSRHEVVLNFVHGVAKPRHASGRPKALDERTRKLFSRLVRSGRSRNFTLEELQAELFSLTGIKVSLPTLSRMRKQVTDAD